jgi:hypothetical protein
VNRSTDFGVEECVNLAVDGVQVGVLAFNQSYDAALSPGKHVLSITTNPRTYAQQFNSNPSERTAGRDLYFYGVLGGI